MANPKIQFDFDKQAITLCFDNWTLFVWKNKENDLIYSQAKEKGKKAKPQSIYANDFRTHLKGEFTQNEKVQKFIEKAIAEFDLLLNLY